jgi:hypothetical protein
MARALYRFDGWTEPPGMLVRRVESCYNGFRGA